MIPLMKSTFYNEQRTREHLRDFLAIGSPLSMGEKCRAFEETFARKQGRKYAVLTSSGGMANLVLIQALINLELLVPNDSVGFSAVTWSTNVMPVIQLGLRSVPIDVQPNTLNISTDSLNGASLDCLFLTNALGFCADIRAVRKMRGDIPIIEDNCESLGTVTVSGERTGNFGLASTFSFYVSHHISTIEGGMVCTDDEALADMLLMVRSNGWSRDLSRIKRKNMSSAYHVSAFDEAYTFYHLGYNAKPTEITGFLGCEQMQYYDEIMLKRERNYHTIARKMRECNDLIHTADTLYSSIPAFAIPVVCDSKETREKYISIFQSNGIEIRPLISGDMTQQPFYRNQVSGANKCMGASFLKKCAFYCGNSPEYTRDEIDTIISCFEQ